MRSSIPDGLMKERCLRDEKYITVYDQFTPNYNRVNLTPKFYSKYERQIEEPDQEILQNVLENYKSQKEKRSWPETTNQWYGWFLTPFSEENRSDSRLYFPIKSSDMVKHMLSIIKEKSNQKIRQ